MGVLHTMASAIFGSLLSKGIVFLLWDCFMASPTFDDLMLQLKLQTPALIVHYRHKFLIIIMIISES